MQRKVLLTIFYILVNFSLSFAQELKICAYKEYLTELDIQKACGFSSYMSNQRAEQVIDKILSNVGLFRNFIIKECPHMSNAAAASVKTSLGGFDRYIIYDKAFLDKVSGITGTDWSAISILAHEIGHHLNGHTLMAGINNHEAELQADEFSGFVLAKMGASLDEALSAINEYGTINSTNSHPNKFLRIQAISKGWNISFNGGLNSANTSNITLYEYDEKQINYFYNKAIEMQNINNFSLGSDYLIKSFQFSGGLEKSYLYYAASFSVSAKDYDKALLYYEMLKKVDYSGEHVNYYAKNISKKREEVFPNKVDRDNAIKFKTHKNPRDEKIPSKRGEIYSNIALILMQQGKVDEAKSAFSDARKMNPNDVSLIISEAILYYNQGDFATYKKIIKEAATKNPTNPELFYNLGVAAIKTNDYKQAEAYYLKAIELNPKYGDAYYNISILKIEADAKIVEEMNGLGNTPKDNARYNVLKGEREKIFKDALPYLEKAVELNDSNEEAKRTLLNIYSMLDMTDKYKALKAKM